MSNIEIALERALKRIESLEEQIRNIENARSHEQVGFWHMVLVRLANQDMIRGAFHTEILRSAGLLANAPFGDIEAKAKTLFVDNPRYTLDPRLANLNLQAVVSEMQGEYKSADSVNPKLKDQD
ncbi:hypothetical protein M8037_10845 [Sinorhizobium meliloti]|uniref:hypothetical protein n=1 Tax=Rhizobium meliloti TaxID=382 RepID=UPI0020732DFE|nr:hypothetical protein [Sinorhizobium meliloti]MCM5689294.1 hypothetical protein [Sinorhizobium meliloti]